MRLDSACRYFQRDICSYTYRIRIKWKSENFVHQNVAQIAIFKKNADDKGVVALECYD